MKKILLLVSVFALAKMEAAQASAPALALMTKDEIAAQLQAARDQLTVAPAAIPREGRLRVAGQYGAGMFKSAAIGAGLGKLVYPLVMDVIDEGYRYGFSSQSNILNALVGLAALAGGSYGIRSVWNERAKKEEKITLQAQKDHNAQKALAGAQVTLLEQLLASSDDRALKETQIDRLGQQIRDNDSRIFDLNIANADLVRRIAVAEDKVREFEELQRTTNFTQQALEDLKRGLSEAQIQLQQFEVQKAAAQSARLGLAEIRAKQALLVSQGDILEKAVALLNPELPDSPEKRILIEGTSRLISTLQACEEAANQVHCRMEDNVCFLNLTDRATLDRLESTLASIQGGNLLDRMGAVLRKIEGAVAAATATTTEQVEELQDQQLALQLPRAGAASASADTPQLALQPRGAASASADAVPTVSLTGSASTMGLHNSFGDGAAARSLSTWPLSRQFVLSGPQRALMAPFAADQGASGSQQPAAVNSGAGGSSSSTNDPAVEEVD